jgi:hypothetical protein
MEMRRMGFRVSRIVLVVLWVAASWGCTKHIEIQKTHVVEDPLLPRLRAEAPVQLVAKPHPTTGVVKFCDPLMGASTLEYADLTAYAVQSLTDILQRNQVAVVADTPKTLTVGVVAATCDEEASGLKFNVTLSAAAGEMPARSFTGFQRSWSAHGNNFAVTAATLNAVLEMFKDPEIRAYLEEG